MNLKAIQFNIYLNKSLKYRWKHINCKKIYFIFLLFFYANSSFCLGLIKNRVERKILFIGNSITYYHGMPQTLQKMILEQRLNIKISQLTLSGYRLGLFAKLVQIDYENARIAEKGDTATGIWKILSERWSAVVLQEATSNILIPEFRSRSFEPTLIFFDSIIKSINGQTILFQPYARYKYPYIYCGTVEQLKLIQLSKKIDAPYAKKNDDSIQYCSHFFHTRGEEFAEIEAEISKMAENLGARTVKVGYAFEIFKKKHPNLTLVENDLDSHPSKQGSYLIACLFFKCLTGKNLQHVKYSADLDPKEAQLIRKFADTIH